MILLLDALILITACEGGERHRNICIRADLVTIFAPIRVNKRHIFGELLCQVCRALKFNAHIFMAYFAKCLRSTTRRWGSIGFQTPMSFKSTNYRKHLLTRRILQRHSALYIQAPIFFRFVAISPLHPSS